MILYIESWTYASELLQDERSTEGLAMCDRNSCSKSEYRKNKMNRDIIGMTELYE